jgi:hypothetical protein
MLNVLKKVEKLRRGIGGEKDNSLEPPKNLPDLARDIYERNQQRTINSSADGDATRTTIQSIAATSNIYNISRPIHEPSKDSVPGLDLSLVHQHLAASQSAIQSIPPQQSAYSQPAYQSVPQPVIPKPISIPIMQPTYSSQPNVSYSPPQENLNAVNDDTGFFKEFEEYVRNNGLNNDIIDELLDKNLLDHMMFYHTTKGEDMPFYASSAELSHAIKVKLEDLQNFERTWISNKQKMDLMKKWSSTIESDIHLKSEELKRLLIESRRRGGVNNIKSADFFQISKSKTIEPTQASINVPKTSVDVSFSSTPTPISPTIASSVYRPSSTSITSSSMSSSKVSPLVPQQSIVSSNYSLNKYVTHDSSKYFYAVDGQVFKSLFDLMNGLENMNRDAFAHHVNDSRNDFANWVKGVFGDLRLADSMRSLVDIASLWHFLKNNTY